MIKKARITLAIAALVILPLCASASELPEPLTGFATITKDGEVYHVGMGANQVILNHDQNTELGFDNTTRTKTIQRCIDAVSADPYDLSSVLPTRCFFLTPESYDSYLMTGRAYRNDSPQVEIAALIYDKVITGDVYGMNSGLNFALYGRNLKQKSPNVSNETWDAGDDYELNPEAQSSLSAFQAEYVVRRVREMAGEAQVVSDSVLKLNPVWNLQGSNITDGAQSDAAKYPEGKVWIVRSGNNSRLVTASNVTYKYKGKGTIIFLQEDGGYLEMSKGAKIEPDDPNKDSLGVIIAGSDVSGNVAPTSSLAKLDFKGNNYINAAVLSLGAIKSSATGNIEAEGSFVAGSFSFSSSSGSSIVFRYNPMLEDNWPPGFRYFNMPRSENTAP